MHIYIIKRCYHIGRKNIFRRKSSAETRESKFRKMIPSLIIVKTLDIMPKKHTRIKSTQDSIRKKFFTSPSKPPMSSLIRSNFLQLSHISLSSLMENQKMAPIIRELKGGEG